MKVEMLDVVLLKDGREAAVLEVFDKGKAFLVETNEGKLEYDSFIVSADDITAVVWKYRQ